MPIFSLLIVFSFLTISASASHADERMQKAISQLTGKPKYVRPPMKVSRDVASYTDAIKKLKAPAGFKISLWALVPNARSMAQASDGTLFVGTRSEDHVYRIKDWNQNGQIDSDEVEVFIDGLETPNGVAFRKGSLYVGEIKRILEFKNVLQVAKGQKVAAKEGVALSQTFPSDKHHGWKFIRFAPAPNDNWLYVPVGAPCNICESDPVYAAIHKINVEGKETALVASGIRNTVGFDFHPTTQNLWFTDNGRDLLGDDIPGDELNELTTVGQHFGYPYCHQGTLKDSDLNGKGQKDCQQYKAPMAVLGAHVAALGMRFYRGSQFPASYKDQIFFAEHGSWNSSTRKGYKVSLSKKSGDKQTYENFITGWLDESTQAIWGRPVDVEELPDGSLLISDDGTGSAPFTGAIYKVQYSK